MCWSPSRPRARIPRKLAEYRDVAWLGTRQPITVLPSVASLKALRQFAKTSRATKPYLGIGNPLLDGPQDHPQWGEHYKKQAEAARSKQQCPRTAADSASRSAAARPLAGFTKLFRGGQADIEQVRRWTPLPETADELCEVARRLGVPESEILLGATRHRGGAQGPLREGPPRRLRHPALRHARRAHRPGAGLGRAGLDPDAASRRAPAMQRRWSATMAFSPHPRSPPSSSMPTG